MNLNRLAYARSLASTGEGQRLRRAADLSVREVADGVGVTATTLSRWERGTHRPRGPAALRWAGVLSALTTAAEPAAGQHNERGRRS